MICEKIIELLEQQAPKAYACEWDNVGLLVGSREKEVRRIFIALDATDETIAEAVALDADLLLPHHPMIFRGLKKVNTSDFIGRRVIELIRNDISYYAMHTNFDVSDMADLAAERMGLVDTAVLQPTGWSVESMQSDSVEAGGTSEDVCASQDKAEQRAVVGIGKVGMLPRTMTLRECAEETKRAFGVDTVKVFADFGEALGKPVQKIAICPGSGKSVIEDALRAGAQVLITGDIDHHEGIDAVARGMAVIDAGHYGVEKIFIPYMKQYLEERLEGVEVIAQEPKQPFLYI